MASAGHERRSRIRHVSRYATRRSLSSRCTPTSNSTCCRTGRTVYRPSRLLLLQRYRRSDGCKRFSALLSALLMFCFAVLDRSHVRSDVHCHSTRNRCNRKCDFGRIDGLDSPASSWVRPYITARAPRRLTPVHSFYAPSDIPLNSSNRNDASPSDPDPATSSPLGIVPHQIRGFLARFDNLKITGQAYNLCTGCSGIVILFNPHLSYDGADSRRRPLGHQSVREGRYCDVVESV